MFSYSFWADEAYISGVATQLVRGQLTFSQVIGVSGITYQKLHMLIISGFFRIFGITEFVARIPSMIVFACGIIIIFLLAKKLSNLWGGVVASFLFTFSHLNLSYATQAKPYIYIEVITLIIIYLLNSLTESRTLFKKVWHHSAIILLLACVMFLHYIGIFLWILYLVFVIQTFKRSYLKPNLAWLIVIPILAIVAKEFVPVVIRNVLSPYFFSYNFIYQSTKLFAYKYALIFASAVLGWVWIFNKQKKISTSVLIYCLIVFVTASFDVYIFNIRYVLSLFGILFLYFGIFWAKVGEKYDNNLKFKIYNWKLSGKMIIPLVVILLIYISGYKIVRWPQTYYNPNIDKYGDVQIANYKDFYSQLKQKFPNYKDIYVANDLFDTEYWYFGRYSNVYFMKFVTKPYQHATVKRATVYGSLEDFKKMMKDHPQGLLIMEDWQSFLPDDIKMYAKKNLKLEFRVESLKEAPDDPWPLALYSWGLK